ncbi:MAG: DUF6264 family protein [Pseudoclavibacter sp.]|nr:DUF6264 family protein [Pseudoclavibacter sp.]
MTDASGRRDPAEQAPPAERAEFQRRRTMQDRVFGIGLLVFGGLGTIMHMQLCTVNALAAGYAQLFAQNGLSPYVRPDGLEALSWAGLAAHPLLYALVLYWSLVRRRAGKRFMWLPVLGSLAAMLLTLLLSAIGVAMHPQLLELGATPAP